MSLVLARRLAVASAAVLAALGLPGVAAHAGPVGPATTITNGTVELGVQPEGNLIVPQESDSGGRGIAFRPSGFEGLGGCCEGWGVADVGSGLTGSVSQIGGRNNVTAQTFVSDGRTASSIVTIPQTQVAIDGGSGKPTFQVTHSFAPADETPNLYRVRVAVKNTSNVGATDLRYRRLMDWNVQPTPNDEFVTNQPGGATNVTHVSNDGFETLDPLKANSAASHTGINPYVEGPVEDFGPMDQGSLWDLSFGPLAAGATRSFTIFYGAAASEAKAFDALQAVGAEAYGLAQANTDDKPSIGLGARAGATRAPAGPVHAANEVNGEPTTFIFGLQGVGGPPIFTDGAPYVLVAKDGGVFAPGGQGFYGTAATRPGDGILRDARGRIISASGGRIETPVVAFAYTPTRKGYWLVQADGRVYAVGDAPDLGHVEELRLRAPIVGAAATPDGKGLYLVAADGGIFSLGTAPFRGSLGAVRLNRPIVGMGLDSDGSGYVLAASDGGVFTFDASFHGSLGAARINKPIVGIAVSPAGGYVLAASDGGAFAYDTPFAGSLGGVALQGPIVGIAADPDGAGYWMAGADGGAFAFGARFFGSVASILLNAPISGIAAL